jgi:triphosphoribosyl-dephospho-CoA synthase
MINVKQLEHYYIDACETELQAFKPGNISVYADGHDMTVADFRISAEVSAAPLCNPAFSLGEKIYYAVKATREAVHCNTNLGIILLCAPLIQAAFRAAPGQSFRQSLQTILGNTTIEDAGWAFKAVSLASPGGLGETKEQDVRGTPTVTLTEAMKMASDRDRIALQYTNVYKDILEFSVLRYNWWLSQGRDKNWSAVFVYTDLLSQFPDSHIERKYGEKHTDHIAVRMRQFLEEFGQTTDPAQLEQRLYRLDTEFKTIGVNPGTTADFTVATILSAHIEDYFRNSMAVGETSAGI